MTPYLLCLILFGIGVYCILSKRNIVKIIVGVGIAECAVNLFFLLVAYRVDGRAPILAEDGEVGTAMVDPLPHALVLTDIVIGLATTALLVALALRLYQAHGTFDINEMTELRG